jgi:hypothetical protein
MEWNKHPEWARLEVDLAAQRAVISYSDPKGDQKMMIVPPTVVEVDR